MEPTSASTVYVTTGSREDAIRIGRTIVEERLAACANVLDGMSSLYWWEGGVQEDPEAVLILKTRTTLVEAVTNRVREVHPYDCPCVVAWPIVAGNAEFLAWIERETVI